MKERPQKYRTRQGDAILAYIASLPGENHTPVKLADYFAKQKIFIGRTTVYRQLERLVQEGKLRKYHLDGILSACYQYVGADSASSEQCHLRCDSCGERYNLECEIIPEVNQHIFNEHEFWVNDHKTVFYGTCKDCLSEEEKKQDK